MPDDHDERVGRIEGRLDTHDEHIGDLRVTTARLEASLEHLSGAYERAADAVVEQAKADSENRRAEIAERAAQGSHRREIQKELVFKFLTVLMGAWAIVMTILKARC